MSNLEKAGFFVCSCFFSSNIFLPDYNIHVAYEDDPSFIDQYKDLFSDKYQITQIQLKEQVLPFVKGEVYKRRNRGKLYLERCIYVEKNYKPLFPEIYDLNEDFFDPEFLKIVSYCKSPGASKSELLKLLKIEAPSQTYSFPVFTNEFCQKFTEELKYFEQSPMPKERPNTMNNYGLLLSEIGLDAKFINPWREKYLQPISQILFSEWCGDSLDSHRVFVVQYQVGQDIALARHYDNAEVTINVSLGEVFEGGDLFFGNMRHEGVSGEWKSCKHVIGRGIMHRGQQFHGAVTIKSGVRKNLIMWMRSSKLRNECCPMCDKKPQLVPSVGYGDGFTTSA